MIFTTDILVIAGILVVGTFFTFFFGKSKGVILILSLFGAIPLYQSFPFVKQLTVATGALPIAANILAIFLAFVVFMFFLLNKYIVGDFIDGNFFKSVIFGLAFVTLILALFQFVLPLDALYNFGPNIDKWFAGNFVLFWWLTIPLGIVFFV
ncbi:MAG: hypothetical protein ACYCZW_00890 [Minisyncoccota bacterium]